MPRRYTHLIAPLTVRVGARAKEWAFTQGQSVVDTFGLCSFSDPVEALREMKRVVKPGGKILLLEHGKSHYQWLTTFLNERADAHAERYGCYWNRDILALVEKSGLRVEEVKRRHFGTTYYIIVNA
mmetsp:Transcript_12315/g.33023  ORF Transcript_12315/g.33023 Transcript_12315/m.33023 type:complete len:126 (+) Transcript_12315:479-856(+)